MVPQVRDYYSFALIVGSQRDRFSVEDVYHKMIEFHDHFLTKMKEDDYQKTITRTFETLWSSPSPRLQQISDPFSPQMIPESSMANMILIES